MNPFGIALILLISALLSGSLAVYAWRRRGKPGAGIFFFLMLGTTIAVFAYGMELLSATLSGKLAWVRIRYAGTALIYPMYLLLALWYTNKKKWFAPGRVALLFVLPVFSLIVLFTNSLHHLHYASISLNTSGPFPMIAKTYGPLFAFYFITSFGYVLLALAILGSNYLVTSPFFRRQTAALMLGTIAPLAAAWLYNTGMVKPLGGLNILPFAYIFSSLTAAWVILGRKLFDLRPFAHGMIFENMTDGFIVLNKQLEILDANPPALRLLDLLPDHMGQFGNKAFVNHPALIRLIHNEPHAHVQIEQDGQVFDAFRTSLFDQQQNLAGHLISLRDVTSIKKAEEALRKSENQYRFLAENMNDVLWMMDLDLKTVYVSPSIEAVLGFTQEERLRQDVQQQLTPQSLRIARETLAREKVLEKQTGDPKRKATLTLEFCHRDGSTRWLETIISGIRDDQGTLTGLYGASRDVSGRKEAEASILRFSEELREKNKELQCLYSVSEMVRKGQTLQEDILSACVSLIPQAYDCPEIAGCRIPWEDREYKTENFARTSWMQTSDIRVRGNSIGKIEVCYLEPRPEKDEGPFSKEDRKFLDGIADLLGKSYERRLAAEEREKLIEDLKNALQEVKTLTGMLRICASCKKIRNDQGYWERIERYISERSSVQFSHGICPECMKKLYPEMADHS